MTSVLDPERTKAAVPPEPRSAGSSNDKPKGFTVPAGRFRFVVTPLSGNRRPQVLVAIWLAAVVIGMALVIYGFGPFFQQRTQRRLLAAERSDITRAANEATGLEGLTVPNKAVAPGSPVGILEIGAVKMQQAVVEGVNPAQTRGGPGHVPGTAGLGQPGNSVVVGRRTAFGGPFKSLARLRKGETIAVTTFQGPSIYRITSVRHVGIHGANGTKSSTIDGVYGPSKDDRLTLVTSGNALPWNEANGLVVVAKMQGVPFTPTPQGGRLDSAIGNRPDSSSTSSIVLVLVLYGATISASLLLYRRLRPQTAYLLTIGPILAATIIAAETLSRALPAWV